MSMHSMRKDPNYYLENKLLLKLQNISRITQASLYRLNKAVLEALEGGKK